MEYKRFLPKACGNDEQRDIEQIPVLPRNGKYVNVTSRHCASAWEGVNFKHMSPETGLVDVLC